MWLQSLLRLRNMALFSRTKKADTAAAAPKATKPAVATAAIPRNLANVIVRPYLTEKAVSKTDANQYTFIVSRTATKFAVRDAIKALYNVTPVRVNIVNRAPAVRHSGSRNRDFNVAGQKKAYVHLKKGDTINIV